ncbi:MAG TPA: cupin domain-containing protein [Chloroflexota bacterium]|nr:cupin domain-containing protein [Chloroflexota bacterium]
MSIIRLRDIPEEESRFPGVTRKSIVVGENLQALQLVMRVGTESTRHRHGREQISYCLSGTIEVDIDGEITICRAGTMWHVPGGTWHGARAVENSLILETFSPPIGGEGDWQEP